VKREIILFPYLPLRDRTAVDGWTLIPSRDVQKEDCVDDLALNAALGLLRLYSDQGGPHRAGALAQPPSAIGDPVRPGALARLRRAVMVACLDTNPSGVIPDDEQTGNEGWATYTSEHLQIWGHAVDDHGRLADQRGGMVTVLTGGYNVLETGDLRFAPPPEMHQLIFARPFDDEYATAVHRVLGARGETARRLARTIDWLGLAWQNADSIDQNLRIVSLFSGFEVILAKPADAKAAALALGALLDPPGTRTRCYKSWRTRKGKPVPDKISQLSWWFVQFAWLRNAILHGDRLTARNYHDRRGRPHKWVAELTLRHAIKETVACAGYPDIRVDPATRTLTRAIKDAISRGEFSPPPGT